VSSEALAAGGDGALPAAIALRLTILEYRGRLPACELIGREF